MPQTTTQPNGVNVDQLVQTIEAVKENPDIAQFQFRAHTSWKGGGRSETSIQHFTGAGGTDASRTEPFRLHGDEPPVLLGTNTAPNAVEAVLHALGSCLAVGFVYNAAAKGIKVASLEFDLEGDLDLHGFLGLDETRAGYRNIRVRYQVEANAPRDELVALCDQVQKTSPVLDILRNPVDVEVKMV